MNTFKTKLGMGVALMSLIFSSQAFAQVAPTQRLPMAGDSSLPPPEQLAAVAPDQLNGGLRAVQPGDNSKGVWSFERFGEIYKDPKVRATKFAEIRAQNAETCANTGRIVREALHISAEAHEIDGKLSEFDGILVNLGKKQNAAAGFSGLMQVVSTGALCILSGGAYCVAAVAGGAGNIGQTAAHWNTQKVDRGMRKLNVKQSHLQIRATLLTMSANILWANTMQDYCLSVFPQQTLGTGAQATQQGKVSPEAVYRIRMSEGDGPLYLLPDKFDRK